MIAAFGFNHNAYSDDSRTQLRIDFWDPNTIHRLTWYLPLDGSAGTIRTYRPHSWPSGPKPVFQSHRLRKKHPIHWVHKRNCGRGSRHLALSPQLHLHIHPRQPYLLLLSFVHFHSPSLPPPWFKPLSALSNFCPLQTVLAKVTGEASVARDPRQVFSAHLGGSSAAQDTAEHPFLETHLLWCLVWQRCDSAKIKFGKLQ